jgi:ADP-ribosyl-[dinitrogen reductase] hydrolase
MALCLATSLVECAGFDARDQMERYCRWADEGYLSSTGYCFDIGNTVRAALGSFLRTGEPFSGSTDPCTAGNGSIMRLAPIPIYFFDDRNRLEELAADSSRTTHGTAECLDACRLFAGILRRALAGASREEVLAAEDFHGESAIEAIAQGGYRHKARDQIQGLGYVVPSLEAALWSFHHSESFEEAILLAANLGDDADTTAAICGQLAGAFYGEEGIPGRWLEWLTMRSEIAELAQRLADH